MSDITIRDIKTTITAPRGVDLVVVKIETSEPGLYGLGCATFTQRSLAVKTALDEYLKPLLIGRKVNNIEDIWQLCMNNPYWRNGPVLNNAISGIDEALWDIKGKMANMPVYELLGGKCREGAAIYRHAFGATVQDVEDTIRGYMEQGIRHMRFQLGFYGGSNFDEGRKPEGAPPGAYFDPAAYMRETLELVDYLRDKIGWELELCHDVHERLTPVQALGFAKELEPYKLFFLEDALPPDQVEWFEFFRHQTAVPIAMGELFNNPMEWKKLVSDRLIDFIRVHVSQIGGITPARKLAAFCEGFGVRTAWHGPFDIAPVGVAAHLHLDLAATNFGVQEFAGFSDAEEEIFPGCPTVKNGYLYANEKPGWGIDFDEEKAKKFPRQTGQGISMLPGQATWTQARLPDGTLVHP